MATLSPERPPLPASSLESSCPHCERLGYADNGWCRFCGYYGVLGKCVDLAEWEQDFVNGEYVGEEEVAEEQPWIAAIKAVPDWAWYLGGVLVLVALINLLVRLCTQPGSAYHVVGAVGLLAAGLLVSLVTHIYAGICQTRADPEFSFIDIAIHPVQLWCAVFMQFPRTVDRVALLWGGLWTAILVHVVVGVPYLQLIDLTTRPNDVVVITPGGIGSVVAGATPRRTRTLKQVLGEVSKKETDGKDDKSKSDKGPSLKDAFGQVLGELAVDGEGAAEGDEGQVEDELEPGFAVETLDALIIGYTAARGSDDIRSLIVAVKSKGAWRVAGKLSSGLTAEAQADFKSQLGSIHRGSPFVQTELKANWVEPILRCRIQAAYSESEDRFGKLEFVEQL